MAPKPTRDRTSTASSVTELEVIGGDVPTDQLLELLADFLIGLVDADESKPIEALTEGSTE